jgi:hypothetical protein
MRRLRFLIAIPAIAALAIMGATGASAAAAPAHQAARARALTAASSGADPWVWENGNGLFIYGTAHNEPLTGDTSGGTTYTISPQVVVNGVHFYSIHPLGNTGLCWDTLALAGDTISPESCPANDDNEWFSIPSSGTTGYIQTYLTPPSGYSQCVTGEGNGNALKLENCGTYTNRQYWTTYSV